jgi:hypothetical protein
MNEETGGSMTEETVMMIDARERTQPFSLQEGHGVFAAREERRDRMIRIVLTLFLVGILAFVIIDSFTNQYIEGILVGFINWIKENPSLGVLAVILVYIVATVLFVPGSILTLGTGYAFGSAFESTAKGVALASTVRGSKKMQLVFLSLPSISLLHYNNTTGSLYWCHIGEYLCLFVGSVPFS